MKTRLLLILALAALPLLGSCAIRTVEPRLPPTTASAETRHALLTAGLHPATIEGPRGTLRYYEGGQGKTLVLLHGSGSQAGDWNGVIPPLVRRYRVLVLDLPGHGESGPAEGPLPVGDLADSLGALLDARSADQPATLIGNSLGGWVSLLYALRHPERVERVIGISSSGIYAPLQVPITPKTREEARRLVAAIRGPHLPTPSDEELDAVVQRVTTGPAGRLFAGLRAEDFLDTKAAEIRVPVELVWGEEDGVLPLAYGQRLASLLPRARLHPLPRCGHMPQVHCPRELSRLLLDLLAAPPEPPASSNASQEPATYAYRTIGGQELRAYVFPPASRHPRERASAILLFHGGGWDTGAPDWTFDTARRFAALGMVAIPVEYRLSQGDVTPIDALEDVCTAFRWARQQAADLGIDPQRVAGYGTSAGGHLVASAATVGCPPGGTEAVRAEPDLLLLWSPALDMARDGWFEKKLQGRAPARDYSPADHVSATTPPTSIVQGAEDTLTPLAGAQRYCEQLTAAGKACELNVYKGVGHLLTRNLANQESDYDPDPEARANGIAQHASFLRKMGFIHLVE